MALTSLANSLRSQLGRLAVNRTVRNVGTVYVGKMGEAAIRFVGGVLMTRALGPERLGVLVTVVTVATIACTCMLFGLNNTAVKFVADARKDGSGEAPVAVKAVGIVFGLATAVTALGMWLGAPLISRYLLSDASLTPLVYLALPLAVLNAVSILGGALVRGYERFTGLVLTNIVGQSLRLLLIVAVIGWGLWLYWQGQGGQVELRPELLTHSMLDETDMIIANMFAAVVIVIGDLLLLRTVLLGARRADLRKSATRARQVGGYSWWIFLSLLVGIGYQMVNVLILKAMKTAETVGYYSAALNVLKPFEFFPESINQVILPKASEIRSRRHFYAVSRKIILAGMMLSLPVVPLVVVPGVVIRFLFGETFLPAAPIVVVTAIQMILSIIFNPFYVLLHRLNVPRAFTVMGILVSACNIGLNVLLVPSHGAVGSATATLISFLIGTTYLLTTIVRRANRMEWEEE